MLGFFSCGKEAVAPQVNNFNDGTIEQRNDDIDCDCTLKFIGLEPPSSTSIWQLWNNGSQLWMGTGSNIETSNGEDKLTAQLPIVGGILTIDHFPLTGDFSSFEVTIQVTCVASPGGEISITNHTFSFGDADCFPLEGGNKIRCSWFIDTECGKKVEPSISTDDPCPTWPDC